MNLLQGLLDAQQGGGAVREIAHGFGLSEDQTRDVMGQVVPALSRGIRRNTQQQGGVEALLGALAKGSHSRYVEQPATLREPGAVADGNAILGHLFGSKDVSRNVAAHAANQTGVAPDIIRKMLPVLAAAVMGSLGQRAGAGASGGGDLLGGLLSSLAAGGRKPQQQGGDLLTSFLDADGDGSAVDDLLDMAKRFF